MKTSIPDSVGGMRRQHGAYFLYDARKWVFLLFIPVLRAILTRPDTIAETVSALLAFLRDFGFACLLAGWFVLRWRRALYRFRGSLTTRRGVFLTRTLQVSMEDAASIEVECSPLLWAMRSRRVHVNTAGLRRRSDVTLYLPADEARLFLPPRGAEIDGRFAASPWPVAAMSASSSNAALGLLTLAPALKQAGNILGRELPAEMMTLADRLLSLGLPPLLETTANVLIIGWSFAFIRSFFRYAGFCARRQGGCLHLISGLMTRRDVLVDCRRITALELRQTLFMRIFRLYTATITAAGYGRERGARPVVVPAARARELCAALDTLLGDYPLCSSGLRPGHRSLGRYILLPLWVTAGALLPFLMGGVWIMAGVVWLTAGLWWLAIRWMGFHRATFGVGDDAVVLRYSRGLALYEVHVPLEVADCLIVTRSPWQRRSGTCTVELRCYGEKRRRHRVWALPYDAALHLAGRLTIKPPTAV